MNNLNATIYNDTLTAGQVFPRQFIGAYFKIISATGPINIKANGVDLKGLSAGQGFEKIPFDRLEITDASGASNTIKYIIATEGFLDGLTGAMQITQNVPVVSGSFVNNQATVTNASTQIVAANTARKYLYIENNDPTGDIFIGFGAAAVTALNGKKISPGGFYEFSDVQSTQAIKAIGSLATQSNVVVIEG